ncbi:MAG: dTMP kinase [Nitrososphaerales archaeon]
MQIVIEGPDGSGKSTIATELVEWLYKDNGIRTIYTKNPGATPLGYELRRIISDPILSVNHHVRALLFAVDNAAYITTVLKPKLDEGWWIVADRNNFISSIAYEIADGCSLDSLLKIHEATYPIAEIPKIDVMFILRVNYDIAVYRRTVRTASEKKEYYEKQMYDIEFFNKVSQAYDRLVNDYNDLLLKYIKPVKPNKPNIMYIDANQPLEYVVRNIHETIRPYIDAYKSNAKA